jgi:hypothetical protein
MDYCADCMRPGQDWTEILARNLVAAGGLCAAFAKER